MFKAKVYTVMIPSSGVALEEEHIYSTGGKPAPVTLRE